PAHQLPDLAAGAVQPRSDGADPHAERRGDLLVLAPFRHPEDQDSPELGLDLEESPTQPLGLLLTHEPLVRPGRSVRRLLDLPLAPLPSPSTRERPNAPAPAGTELMLPEIEGRPVEICVKARVSSEPADRHVCPDQRLLRQILRLRTVPVQAIGQDVESPSVEPDDLVEIGGRSR